MTRLEQTLAELVASPTVSTHSTRELAAMIARRSADAGMRVELFEDPDDPDKVSVIASAGPADPEGGLILSGHLDVVPVEGQRWSSDPFRLSEREGRLHGRGTTDMKGFVAASLEALDRLDLSSLKRQLVCVWTHDEEIGCVGSAKLVKAFAEQARPLPRECLIGEPTDFRIFRMHPGHVALSIVTHGRSAHSSKPDLGRSALKAMTRVLLELEAIEEEQKGRRRLEEHLDRPYVTMNAARIRGGVAVNMVPDRVELSLGYRPLPGDDPLALFREIEARLAGLDVDAELEVERLTRALWTPEGTPLQALCAEHASDPRPCAASYATDGGNFAELGIHCLVFGPGSIDVAHAPDEFVDRAALHRCVDVLETMLRSRCT